MGNQLTHLSLFSGIGGLDLAAEWAGFKTIGQCEWADYPTKVLEKHWPDVPRWRDIRTLTKESFIERTGLRTVDIISGGFPCQPFSVSGRRSGTEDDRYLWPEMLRVIKELQPSWVLGENVPGIINLALDEVLASLEAAGYEATAFDIPAAGVGAWHRRNRVAILGYAGSCRRDREQWWWARQEPEDRLWRPAKSGLCRVDDGTEISLDWPDTDAEVLRLQRRNECQIPRGGYVQKQSDRTDRDFPGRDYWKAEPCVDRVAHGVPNRVDRIKCLGNAVVPQQFYPFFKAIALIEGGENG